MVSIPAAEEAHESKATDVDPQPIVAFSRQPFCVVCSRALRVSLTKIAIK